MMSNVYNYDSNSNPSRWEREDQARSEASRTGGVIIHLHWASGSGRYEVVADRAAGLAVLDRHVGRLASGEYGARVSETYVDLTHQGSHDSWIELIAP